MENIERQLWDAEALSQRWGISRFSIVRLMKSGELKTITIGARRLVARDEVERVERCGVGTPRKSRKATQNSDTSDIGDRQFSDKNDNSLAVQ